MNISYKHSLRLQSLRQEFQLYMALEISGIEFTVLLTPHFRDGCICIFGKEPLVASAADIARA